MTGGYKIVDFGDINLVVGAEGVNISGVYEAIEGSYRKPILLAGLTVDGVEKQNMYVSFYHSDNQYIAKIIPDATGEATLTVTNDDLVTLAR